MHNEYLKIFVLINFKLSGHNFTIDKPQENVAFVVLIAMFSSIRVG